MHAELQRSYDALKKSEPPAYFIAYSIYYLDNIEATAMPGSLCACTPRDRSSRAQIHIRVGSRDLDNTHPKNTSDYSGTESFEPDPGPREVPWYPGDEKTLRRDLWYQTELAYRNAAQEFGRVLSSKGVSRERDTCKDFSVETPVVEVNLPAGDSPLNAQPLVDEIQALAHRFTRHPGLEGPCVNLKVGHIRRYMENTEGTLVADEQTLTQITITAFKTAKDGEMVQHSETVYWKDATQPLKDKAMLENLVDAVATHTIALARAPRAEPFCGPVILKGSATAVLFHEVLGHRLESSRHREEEDGKTFANMQGHQILPSFISVYDRPLLSSYAGQRLIGSYFVDEEGVAAQNVTLVKNGKLAGFLVSRRPVPNFPHSNGHGRANPEQEDQPESRMANFMVESSRAVSEQDLRRQLLQEARRQKKPYGLLIERVDEGQTQTSSFSAQVFQVSPSVVKRVYVDGRPDELVRGLRIIGTPMAALQRIVQASNHCEVFNGFCGASSGWVPQSNCAPSILIDYLETEREAPDTGVARVLPPPGEDKQ
jgi:TldD protein